MAILPGEPWSTGSPSGPPAPNVLEENLWAGMCTRPKVRDLGPEEDICLSVWD